MGVILKPTRITGDKGSTTVAALFDTGSSDSFIKEDIAERIGTIVILPSVRTFRVADGKGTLQVQEAINLDIIINEVSVFFNMLVVKELAEEMIIGADMMQRWKIRLDLEQEEAHVDPSALRFRL